jgi:hypothetical protein
VVKDDKIYCPLHGLKTEFGKTIIPYSAKLLTHYLAAMCIKQTFIHLTQEEFLRLRIRRKSGGANEYHTEDYDEAAIPDEDEKQYDDNYDTSLVDNPL